MVSAWLIWDMFEELYAYSTYIVFPTDKYVMFVKRYVPSDAVVLLANWPDELFRITITPAAGVVPPHNTVPLIEPLLSCTGVEPPSFPYKIERLSVDSQSNELSVTLGTELIMLVLTGFLS